MKMPVHEPRVSRSVTSGSALTNLKHTPGLSQQGCNWFACASAIARCVSHPDPKQCILDIAPNCLDCL